MCVKKVPSSAHLCFVQLTDECQVQNRPCLLLVPPPKSIADQISRSGFENFEPIFSIWCDDQLLLKSHVVKSSVTASASEFPESTACTSAHPISVSVELCCYCCHCGPLLQVLLGAPCTSFAPPCSWTAASVISISCSKPRFSTGALVGNAEPLPLPYHLPGGYFGLPTPS